MKKKNWRLIRVLSLILICLTLVTIVSPAMEVSAASAKVHKSNKWYNQYYVNKKGVTCYNRYYFPGKTLYKALSGAYDRVATLTAIERCYQYKGEKFHDGGLNDISYYIYTKEDTSPSPAYPNNDRNNRYLKTYCVVWISRVHANNIHGKGNEVSQRAWIDILYCSSGIKMDPGSKAFISVKLKEGNPNLITTCSAEYTVKTDRKVKAKNVGKLVATMVNIATENVAGAIKSAVSWAASVVKSEAEYNSNQYTREATVKWACKYKDNGAKKTRSVGLSLDGTYMDDASCEATLYFTELQPVDAPKAYNKSGTRKATVCFRYRFTGTGIGEKSFTRTYTYSYNFKK